MDTCRGDTSLCLIPPLPLHIHSTPACLINSFAFVQMFTFCIHVCRTITSTSFHQRIASQQSLSHINVVSRLSHIRARTHTLNSFVGLHNWKVVHKTKIKRCTENFIYSRDWDFCKEMRRTGSERDFSPSIWMLTVEWGVCVVWFGVDTICTCAQLQFANLIRCTNIYLLLISILSLPSFSISLNSNVLPFKCGNSFSTKLERIHVLYLIFVPLVLLSNMIYGVWLSKWKRFVTAMYLLLIITAHGVTAGQSRLRTFLHLSLSFISL